MSANDSFQIAVLAGDGIGPEVMAPALDIVRAATTLTPGLHLHFTQAPAGAGHYRDTGTALPDSTVKLCEQGRCHSARGLRAAPYPLSRSDRDHAAGGISLHLRPLCRRASVPADPRDPEPDRGSGRARDRSHRDSGVD